MDTHEHRRSMSTSCLRPNPNQQNRETEMMKFINQNNSRTKPVGRRCHPQQMFGISSESPDYFRNNFSLVPKNQYHYQLDRNEAKNQYQYYSQKHFITLASKGHQKNFNTHYVRSASDNKLAFHRKKGKLTEFLDKNAWMGDNYKLIGKQRSQVAREQAKHRHKIRITKKQQDFQKCRVQSHKIQKKPTHQEFMNELLAQKLQLLRNNPEIKLFKRSQKKPMPTFFERKKEFQVNLPQWEKKEFEINLLEWNTEEKQVPQNHLTLKSKMSLPSTQGTFRSQSRLTGRT